eukprot:6765619-Pyramimonas_sp.AAC.1
MSLAGGTASDMSMASRSGAIEVCTSEEKGVMVMMRSKTSMSRTSPGFPDVPRGLQNDGRWTRDCGIPGANHEPVAL